MVKDHSRSLAVAYKVLGMLTFAYALVVVNIVFNIFSFASSPFSLGENAHTSAARFGDRIIWQIGVMLAFQCVLWPIYSAIAWRQDSIKERGRWLFQFGAGGPFWMMVYWFRFLKGNESKINKLLGATKAGDHP